MIEEEVYLTPINKDKQNDPVIDPILDDDMDDQVPQTSQFTQAPVLLKTPSPIVRKYELLSEMDQKQKTVEVPEATEIPEPQLKQEVNN